MVYSQTGALHRAHGGGIRDGRVCLSRRREVESRRRIGITQYEIARVTSERGSRVFNASRPRGCIQKHLGAMQQYSCLAFRQG